MFRDLTAVHPSAGLAGMTTKSSCCHACKWAFQVLPPFSYPMDSHVGVLYPETCLHHFQEHQSCEGMQSYCDWFRQKSEYPSRAIHARPVQPLRPVQISIATCHLTALHELNDTIPNPLGRRLLGADLWLEPERFPQVVSRRRPDRRHEGCARLTVAFWLGPARGLV